MRMTEYINQVESAVAVEVDPFSLKMWLDVMRARMKVTEYINQVERC